MSGLEMKTEQKSVFLEACSAVGINALRARFRKEMYRIVHVLSAERGKILTPRTLKCLDLFISPIGEAGPPRRVT